MALNVFLGAGLLGTFAAIVAAAWGAFALSFYVLKAALLWIYPSTPNREDLIFFVGFGLFLLISSFIDFHRGLWRMGFLGFAAGCGIILISLKQIPSNGHFDFPWIALILLSTALRRPARIKTDIQRVGFLLSCIFLCIAIMSLLGFLGALSQLVNVFLLVFASGWWWIETQKNRSAEDVQTPPSPLPSL